MAARSSTCTRTADVRRYRRFTCTCPCDVPVRCGSEDECEWLIAEADAHANASGGWNQEGHHDSHKTTDIVVSESEALLSWLRSKLATTVTPALCAQFGLAPADVWLEDAFIVKCEQRRCRALLRAIAPPCDGSRPLRTES